MILIEVIVISMWFNAILMTFVVEFDSYVFPNA